MCGRFAMSKETDELIREYVADGGRAQDWRPAYSVAPTNPAPIVRAIEETEPQRVLELAFWHWPRNPRQLKGAPVINTRIEKLTDRFWVGGSLRSWDSSKPLGPEIAGRDW